MSSVLQFVSGNALITGGTFTQIYLPFQEMYDTLYLIIVPPYIFL